MRLLAGSREVCLALDNMGLTWTAPPTCGVFRVQHCECTFSYDFLNTISFSLVHFIVKYIYNICNIQNMY